MLNYFRNYVNNNFFSDVPSTGLYSRASDAKIPTLALPYTTYLLKEKYAIIGTRYPIEFKHEMYDVNCDKEYISAVKATKALYKLRSKLPASQNSSISLLVKHFDKYPFWFCSLCDHPFLSSAKHNCISLTQNQMCKIPFPNGMICNFSLSDINLKNVDHHKYHSFCLNRDCKFHLNNIWQEFEFENVNAFDNISHNLSDYNIIQVDCSSYDNNIDKREHFLRVLTSLSTYLKASSLQVCSCTNHCLCAKRLIMSEPCLIQSKVSRMEKSFHEIISEVDDFKKCGQGIRILGFDTFSLSKSKTNSKNCHKQKQYCNLEFGLKNFRTAYKKLKSLDHEIKSMFKDHNKKNIFFTSTDLFRQIQAKGKKQFAFSHVFHIKVDVLKLIVQNENCSTNKDEKKPLSLSNRHLIENFDSEDDFEPQVKKVRKKKKVVLHQFGANCLSDDSEEDYDSVFCMT